MRDFVQILWTSGQINSEFQKISINCERMFSVTLGVSLVNFAKISIYQFSGSEISFKLSAKNPMAIKCQTKLDEKFKFVTVAISIALVNFALNVLTKMVPIIW